MKFWVYKRWSSLKSCYQYPVDNIHTGLLLFLPFLYMQFLLRKIYRKLWEALFKQVIPASIHNNHCHTQGILGKDIEFKPPCPEIEIRSKPTFSRFDATKCNKYPCFCNKKHTIHPRGDSFQFWGCGLKTDHHHKIFLLINNFRRKRKLPQDDTPATAKRSTEVP